MTEDFDKELEELAGDLDLGGDDPGGGGLDLDTSDLDLGDLTSGEEEADLGGIDLGAGEDEPEAGAEEASADETSAAGEDVDLDAELQSMLDDSEGSAGDEEAAEPTAGGMEMEEDILGGGAGSGGGGGAQLPAAGTGRPSAQAPKVLEAQTVNLEFLLDIKLHVTFEVGRAKMLISDLLTLGQGSVIELHRLVGDELDLLVNGRLIAKGEVVVVNEKFGCKITEIIPPEDRIRHLAGL